MTQKSVPHYTEARYCPDSAPLTNNERDDTQRPPATEGKTNSGNLHRIAEMEHQFQHSRKAMLIKFPDRSTGSACNGLVFVDVRVRG
jgi:hypothetical protein